MNEMQQPAGPSSLSVIIDHLHYYSVQTVMAMFKVTDRTLRYWRNENKLASIKEKNRVFFEKISTDAALERWERLRFL